MQILATALLLEFSGASFGQEPVTTMNDPAQVAVPATQLPLRAAPPGTFFQGKGPEVGTVTAGESYRVIDKRNIPTILGTQKWLKVQSDTNPNQLGWIYAGEGSQVQVSPAQ